jgi:hypothetical protein
MLKACSIHHCVLGVRARVEDEAVLQDTLVMGNDFFESSEERAVLRERGGIPVGVVTRVEVSLDGLFKEVEVRDAVGHRVELDVLNDAFHLLAVDVQLNFEDVWIEDNLVELNFRHAEVNLLAAAIQHAGNAVVCAERIGIFFPYALTQRAAQ